MKDLIIENLRFYLSVLVTVIGLLCSTITFFLKFIKNVKTRRKCEQLLKITEDIMAFMEEAEQHINYTGQEKKSYVTSRVLDKMLDYNMRINVCDINNKIEKLIELTNVVNVNKSTSEAINTDNNENFITSTKGNNKELARLK